MLHNPKSDRRTTQGIFHVTEGGLPIPDDKLGVPKVTFAKMLALALNPPRELMTLPFTSTQPKPAECFVSLLLRPLVCPEVPGFTPAKTMEVRFFVPGNLVSNLDFVESIFGNGGDPLLPENDSALDAEHWTGHTGCVILAPHLVKATKKSVGLPHFDQATERQRRDGMCWKKEDEIYNNGGAFKLTCRDESGVIVTLIADNYFGYCKKEVKTQISYAANLFGLCEEEHAGGALVFPSYDLGEEFSGDVHVKQLGHTFAEVAELYGEMMDVKPEGYGIDKKIPEIIYIPHDAHFDLHYATGFLAARRRREFDQIAAGQNLRPPVRLQSPHGKAAGREPFVAARRHRGGRLAVPQTLHGFRRRQIGNFQADHGRDFDRAGFCRESEKRFRSRGRIDPSRLLGSFSRQNKKRFARSFGGGTFARLGHQIAHAGHARVQSRLQHVGRDHPAIHQGTRLRREALLQARVGRRLAQPFQRGHHQRHARQRIEMRQPRARHDAPARGF